MAAYAIRRRRALYDSGWLLLVLDDTIHVLPLSFSPVAVTNYSARVHVEQSGWAFFMSPKFYPSGISRACHPVGAIGTVWIGRSY